MYRWFWPALTSTAWPVRALHDRCVGLYSSVLTDACKLHNSY